MARSRMLRQDPEGPQCSLSITWMPGSKQWVVSGRIDAGRDVVSTMVRHARTTAPMDPVTLAGIMHAIVSEMESQLPF